MGPAFREQTVPLSPSWNPEVKVVAPAVCSTIPATHFFTANTVNPTVMFCNRNCSFKRAMLNVPSQMMGASHGVTTRTSLLLHRERVP